ncbi:MAG: ATP-binding protein [Candidatus Hydrothermarchaeales archaeon]
MKIKDRLYLATAITIVLVVILSSAVFLASGKIAEENKKHHLAMEVQRGIFELNFVAHEYLLFREERMIEQWYLRYNSMGGIIGEESAKSLHADYIALDDLFLQLTENYERRQKLIQEGASEEDISAILALEERLAAQLLIKSQSLSTSAANIASEADINTLRLRESTNNLILILITLLTITVATSSFVVAKSIAGPIKKLMDGTEIVGKGDLYHKIDVKSNDEIGALAAAFNEMTKRRNGAEEELQKVNRALQTLSECNQTLVRARNESELLHDICRNIVEVGEYRLVWVGFAEQDKKKTVRPVAQWGYEEGYLDTVNITWADTKRGRGPTGTAIRTGKPSIAKNISTDPDYAPWQAEAKKRGYTSSITLPLVDDDQTFGALNIYAVEPDAFDAEEVGLLTELADDLAFGIVALRTRDEVKRAEEEWRHTFDSISDLVSVHDNNHRFLKVNKTLADSLGKKPEDLIGRHCYEVFHHMNEPWPNCPYNKTLKSKKAVTEEVDDPNIGYPLLVTTSPILDEKGEIVAAVHIAKDITEVKRAENALRKRTHDLGERVKELKGLYGTSQLIADPNKTLDDVFKGTVDLIPPAWQYPDITCARITFEDKQYTTPNWKKSKWIQSTNIVTQKEKAGVIEVAYLKQKPEIDEGPFLKEERNLIDGLARILGDFIERKQAKEALKKAYENLKSLDELKSNVIANVSHELKTPITIVKGSLDLLTNEDDMSSRSNLIGMAKDALMRQNRIVGDLMEAAKMENVREISLSLENVDLNSAITLLLKEFKASAMEKGIKLETKLQGKSLIVRADFERLCHVLRNLVGNALKFTDKDGKITIEAKQKNGVVEVCVSDTGIGIPKDKHEQIFERFYQVDSSATRSYEGTGLGLAIVKEIIETHGRKITVESEPGKGSKFCFTLPVSRDV